MSTNDIKRKNAIQQQIKANPGLNLRQVQRYTNLPLSTTARLLNQLEEEGQIDSVTKNSFRQFFPVGGRLHPRERVVLTYVNKPRPRNILEKLLDNPGIRHGELADLIGLPAPTLTYYMKQLIDADVVKVRKDGVLRLYRIKNTNLVKKALQRTAKTFDPIIAKG